jgi:hypothetical protein
MQRYKSSRFFDESTYSQSVASGLEEAVKVSALSHNVFEDTG